MSPSTGEMGVEMPEGFAVIDKRRLGRREAGENLTPWDDASYDAEIAGAGFETGVGRAKGMQNGTMVVEATPELLEMAETARKNDRGGELPVYEGPSTAQANETLCRLRESNTAAVRENRFDKQEELTDVDRARQGVAMAAVTLAAKLKKLGLDTFFGNHPQPNCVTLNVRYPERMLRPPWNLWIQAPWMYEWSVLWLDSHGLPTRHRFRGWRFVLENLVLARLLTEHQVETEFGAPEGPASERWKRELSAFRNAGGGIVMSGQREFRV